MVAPRPMPVVELHRFSARSRAEWLIAVGRAILVATSLVAVYLDPSEPSRFAHVAYITLVLYLLVALVVATWVARAPVLPPGLGLATHVLDLVFVTTLLIFTDATSSPFFAYIIFALVAATLRWQRRGALWTGPVGLAVFLLIGAIAVPLVEHVSFEPNRFIIRTAYLAVVAVLIAYLGTHEEQLRQDLSRLAAWPQDRGQNLQAELERLLPYAAATLGAPRVAMVWEESEEPWVHLAVWTPTGVAWTREPPGSFAPLAPTALRRAAFLSLDVEAASASVIYDAGTELRRLPERPLPADLIIRLGIRDVLSAPLDGETFTGRLFALDKPRLSPDDLVLAGIVGHYVAAAVDRAYFTEQLREAVTLQERARVAHDLHDGVLQALTAIEFKVVGMASLGDRPDVLRERLRELRDLVREEHAELRRFVRSLPLASAAEPFDLQQQLEHLPARIARQWELAVKVSVDRLPSLPAALGRAVYLLAREAVVNAARHSQGSLVTVEVCAVEKGLRLVVSDNGRGFGTEGRFDHAEVTALGIAPGSLRARVEGLGGTLALESSPGGSRLEAAIPLGVS